MSEAVSALNRASYEGFARIEELGLRGMITLRGDLGAAAMADALQTSGLPVPGQRCWVTSGDASVAWMSPDELLVTLPHGAVTAAVAAMRGALKGEHSLVADVSDARALFRVSGAGAREVLAKIAPVDMSRAAFGPGMIRRTRASQVPVAFWMSGDDAFDVVCFRSVATYLFDLLKISAAPGGEVGWLRP